MSYLRRSGSAAGEGQTVLGGRGGGARGALSFPFSLTTVTVFFLFFFPFFLFSFFHFFFFIFFFISYAFV